MSAQYLVSFNGTNHIEILSDSSELGGTALTDGGGGGGGGSSQTKQKEALYYIVAVITFYALTFMVLFCKYARFKKKELDDTVPYFPLPPDSKLSGGSGGGGKEGDLMALRKYGPRDNYGSNQVTAVRPKVMRVKVLPHWLCRQEETQACDV